MKNQEDQGFNPIVERLRIQKEYEEKSTQEKKIIIKDNLERFNNSFNKVCTAHYKMLGTINSSVNKLIKKAEVATSGEFNLSEIEKEKIKADIAQYEALVKYTKELYSISLQLNAEVTKELLG